MPKSNRFAASAAEGAAAKRLKVLASGDARDFADVNSDVGGTMAKNSLDSDEEDYDSDGPAVGSKYDVDVDSGEEDATIDFDDGVKITPFNMKEELEEGHFDAEGTYHVNKEDEIKDNWLENVDWTRVRKPEKAESSDDEELPEKFDSASCYEQMMKLMEPGETVSAALKRLGGKKTKKKPLTSLERLRRKKLGLPLDEDDPDDSKRAAFITLTGLADSALTNLGFMDVYDETYESLNLKIKKETQTAAVDAVDMFSDEPGPSTVQFSEPSEEEKKAESVKWMYKFDSKPDEILGPLGSAEMSEMLATCGEEHTTVRVRRVDKSEGPWYSAVRVDFDLYD